MTHKIEILLNYSSEDYERIVLMDGIEKYRDKRLWTTSFPEDTDPIRYLEMFLLGEKPQYRCNGCSNSCNLSFKPIKQNQITTMTDLQKTIKFNPDHTPVYDENYEKYEREWNYLRRRTVEFGEFLQKELDRRFHLDRKERVWLMEHLLDKFDGDIRNNLL